MLKKLFCRTPLAWLQLKKEKTRLAVALAGIAFADMLMFVQLGLLDALFDSATKPHQTLQADLVLIKQKRTVETLVNEQNIQVAGLFQMGASFGADGNIVTSDSTFLKLFPDRQANQIEVGLIKLNKGVNVKKIQSQLKATLPNDVRVLTPQEFAQTEKEYWESGGIGFIFGIGVVVGFIVGIVIVYQILYSDVSEHLPEYATLKAMGYSDGYLMVMLMQEALIMSVLGFIPGMLLSMGLYQITFAATLLPIAMKIDRAIFVLTLTIIMCTFSGIVAMRKLQSADPADVF